MCHIMIFFHKGSTVKDKSIPNIIFFVLNNADFPLKRNLMIKFRFGVYAFLKKANSFYAKRCASQFS